MSTLNPDRKMNYSIIMAILCSLFLGARSTEEAPFIAASASSFIRPQNNPDAAIDRNTRTRWASEHGKDPQWIVAELPKVRKIDTLTIYWERAAAIEYEVLVSRDSASWTTIASITDGVSGERRSLTFKPVKARYIKILGKKRTSEWGYSIYEITLGDSDENRNLSSVDPGIIPPTHAGVSYGSGQEIIDMYLTPSDLPTPVFIWGHARGQNIKRIPRQALELCHEAGYSFMSIEGNDADSSGDADIQHKEPWIKMLDFVKANAEKYNIDTSNIFIGGRSLGTIGSFPAAMERWKDVKGIYSTQALPTGGAQQAVLVHKNSPACYLVYRTAPGSNNHDPLNGLMVQEAYKNRGIDDRFSIRTEIPDRQWYNWLIEFMKTNIDDTSSASVKVSRSNFIIIMADDMSYSTASAYDGWIRTLVLERMAEEGMKFSDFHSSGVVCSPTHTGLVTRRYQERASLAGVVYASPKSPAHYTSLQDVEFTFSELLREEGYATALMGKWHLGYFPEYNPARNGFDDFHGFVSGNIDYLSHYDNTSTYDWWVGNKLVEKGGLYNLNEDLGEQNDLTSRYPERTKSMTAAFEAWKEDVKSTATPEPEPLSEKPLK